MLHIAFTSTKMDDNLILSRSSKADELLSTCDECQKHVDYGKVFSLLFKEENDGHSI